MTKIRLFPLLLLFLVGCSSSRKATRQTAPVVSIDRQEYIKTYQDLAIREMKRTGVPASITIAQALLESDNGNSTLARKAHNHFGIKCHSTWRGGTVRHHDDRRNECFRKYGSVYDSYRDHSDFLVEGRRYQFLFDLDLTDYQGWSKGLQKSGYATSKTYARLLIKIIEDNQLYVLDQGVRRPDAIGNVTQTKSSSHGAAEPQSEELADVDEFTIRMGKGRIHSRNRIEYVLVRKGETLRSLTKTFEKLPWELPRYNDLARGTTLEPGQIIYLQPKRSRAEVGNDFHMVKKGETMHHISQQYGIKLDKLYDRNNMEKGTEPQVGTKLWLRGRKP